MLNTQLKLSDVTKDYLTRYYEILDEMIEGMTKVELTDSISHNFIVQMIPHHKAAIAMSENLLRFTTNVALQDIAIRIITEQTKSIQEMEKALEHCSHFCNTQQELYLYQRCYQQVITLMFRDMKSACADNDINEDFIKEMVPHHMGAIYMSENALRFPICPQLTPLLQAIITSQTAGVQEMNQLLREL